MTKSVEQVRRALELAEEGLSASEIARIIDVSRPTIRGWLAGQTPKRPGEAQLCPVCAGDFQRLPYPEYAYLFGQYLGDGTLSRHPRGVWRLRIFTASVYPAITQECGDAMAAVRPANAVCFQRQRQAAVVEVSAYSKHWPCLFPQVGPGRKHKRRLDLAQWQDVVVREFPEQFLRGLIHSDGCRCINKVTVRGKTYEYPRYMFSNRSMDIQELFGFACDLLNIEWRNNNWHSISIAKRDSVAKMDEFIGPKS